ncbi:hypothetical protein CONPUDRAFT_68006 [Coniophora puteana RWD-64-598 SS2]|uniref:Core-binding (CB) domain-containing protein n=1 Tax=Coniophora puteana (strain RWD-64-598) TaxID=741705 RepID=R7SG21_CONPW|nr:uncharacterized protein CONPUDRAFT_68006 [Coniophora puteana RWD-64-598 SS2]EIW74034.1 hypothetical protein CONPUDRAFT_68006 [Coniophora puteana RWD-64-598 SS2]
MSSARNTSRPCRPAWTQERFDHELAVTLGYAVDPSTTLAYTSALNSYLDFCRIHHFPIQLTSDTFAKYIVFMQTYIRPKSISSYLSGICNQLEHLYPEVRAVRKHPLVVRVLRGSHRRCGAPATRTEPLSREHLRFAADTLLPDSSFDDSLFLAQLLVGFYALMRTGELVVPDRRDLLNHSKLSMRHTVNISPDNITFSLPRHKADKTFQGDRIDGVPADRIQALGRWSSDTWKIYVRKHPALLNTFLLAK